MFAFTAFAFAYGAFRVIYRNRLAMHRRVGDYLENTADERFVHMNAVRLSLHNSELECITIQTMSTATENVLADTISTEVSVKHDSINLKFIVRKLMHPAGITRLNCEIAKSAEKYLVEILA